MRLEQLLRESDRKEHFQLVRIHVADTTNQEEGLITRA